MTIDTPEELERSFRDSELAGGTEPGIARRRLLPGSALNVFTEVRFPSHEWALVVQSEERLEDRDLVLASGLLCRTRNGCVEVVARQETDRRLFCTLLADLVRQLTVPSPTPTAALTRRLASWQRMLGQGLPTGLSPEARIGLYGELLVLREIIIPALGPLALRAWTGPSGASQDFVHGSVALEVKTVSRRHAEHCRISSEHQLDSTGLSDLFLVHQVVAGAPEGSSLCDLVDELRCTPAVQVELAWFENCLLESGWLDAHREQYVNDRHTVVRRQCLAVADGFPRVTPLELPAGVSAVSYLVDLSTCTSHRVEESKVQHIIGAGHDLDEG